MDRMIIRGNKALAYALSVHHNTVYNWKKSGVLDKAILSEYGRVIIYDLDKVFQCLNHAPVNKKSRARI